MEIKNNVYFFIDYRNLSGRGEPRKKNAITKRQCAMSLEIVVKKNPPWSLYPIVGILHLTTPTQPCRTVQTMARSQ